MANEPPASTRRTSERRGRAIRRFRVETVGGPQWDEPAEHCAIGSHPSNDLVIDDDTVSRFHCELTIAGASVRVRDLGSRNGTYAGSIQITDGLVPGGTELRLGNSDVRIHVDEKPSELASSEH